MMSMLDSLGYPRAVILEEAHLECGLLRVLFCNNMPLQTAPEKPLRARTAWPERHIEVWNEMPLFPKQRPLPQALMADDHQQQVWTGFDCQDLAELLGAAKTFLQTDFSGIDLPDFVRDAVVKPRSQQHYDRWLVYTDGSSQTSMRRVTPQQADEEGLPDTWSMLVLGEKFTTDGASIVEPLGWCAHPVRYDEHGACYTGAQRIGAEVAERDALVWAGLWRIAQDSVTPTVFCCDSLTSGKQAFGLISAGTADLSYRLLRGLFQALEHGLPAGHLQLHHVRSHAGDPYNEFVDATAKIEARRSFHHCRPALDMQKWNCIIPHLWLVFAQNSGLPNWYDGTLATARPALPAAHNPTLPDETTTGITLQTACSLSIATANVLSLSRGPEGYGGKLHYLFVQMKHFGLNVLGVQEGRAEELTTTSCDILRLTSGHHNKNGGVELWVNLGQPVAHRSDGSAIHFSKDQFQVVHRDPRRLLVKADNQCLSCWFFVGHAPHTGRHRDERAEWWQQTHDILTEFTDDAPCFWILDANAAPGEADNKAVYQRGLCTSANTDLFRGALKKFDMCLPSTTCIHQGTRETWTSIDGNKLCCIDYIAIPLTWLSSCVWSQVLEDFDLATARDDHRVVGLELRWDALVTLPCSRKAFAPIDWTSSSQREQARGKLAQIVVPPWNTDIETHEITVRQQFHHAIQRTGKDGKSRPKKAYIDHEAWSLRSQLLKCRKTLKQLRRNIAREALFKVFLAWSGTMKLSQVEEAFNYGSSLRAAQVRSMAAFCHFRFSLRSHLQSAKHRLMLQRMEHINEHTAAHSILHLLREFTGPTNPRKAKKRTLPLIHDQQGHPCRSPEEATQLWIQFFSDMEGGQRQSHAALREDWCQHLHDMPSEPFQVQAQELPTLVDLELAFRRVSCGKATGPDRIPGETCHYAPTTCAKATFAALWKLLLFGHEALMHKGGLLVQAYKGKGVTKQCASYRSLLISSHIGKALHRTLRTHQAGVFESFLQAQQLGGRRAMPVTYGVHLTRAYMRQAKAAGQSTAIILLDLKEAFYRILRPLCMDGPLTDEMLARLMHTLKMPAEALHELHQLLGAPSALSDAGLSIMEQRSLRAVHLQTHFWMLNQKDVVQTHHGTRPGDPFADFVFSYVWAKVLHRLQHFMRQHDLISSFPKHDRLLLFEDVESQAQEEFIGPTWMDDLAVCLAGPSAEGIVQKAGVVAGRLLELCLEHGMTPNLSKNKTEVLLSLRGSNSRRQKTIHFGPHATGVLPVITEYGMKQIPLTTSYVHLGGLLHHACDQRDEIKRRLGIAFSTLNHHRRLIFRNWKIPLQKRCQLLESLILSKLLYGAETWVVTEEATVAHFHAAVVRLYRRLLPTPIDQHLADDEVLTQLHMPSPIELLRRARLRYVATLHHCGERKEWGLLAADRAWKSLIEDDLIWMWMQIRHSSHMPDPRQNWPRWREVICFHRSYWRRLTRRATEHAILQREKMWRTHAFYIQLAGHLRTTFDYAPHQQPVHLKHGVFGCLLCRKRCRNKAGEAAHMFRVHKQVARRRLLVDDRVCPACLKNFHSMGKLTAHLYYAKQCRRTLHSRNYACDIVPGKGSYEDREKLQAHDRLLPPIQAEGPRQPSLRAREETEVDSELHMYFMETFLDVTDVETAIQLIINEVAQRPISWTTWTATLQFFMDTIDEEDAQLWNSSHHEVIERLETLLDPQQWSLDAPLPVNPETLDELEQECKDFAVTAWPTQAEIPREFSRHRVLLHMFSGRRRPGDLQFFLDGMEAPPHYTLHVVSMDIVVSAIWGDAMAPGTRSYWQKAALDGFVVALMAGPPCETWSKARGQAINAMPNRRLPRILRTADQLWGLPSLALKELEQVLTGNQLLSFTLLMAVIMVQVAGIGAIEHPAEPDDAEAASIFPAVLALLNAPGVQRHRLAQGLFGAPSAKATELMAINMPSLVTNLRSWMLRKELPRGASIGLTSDGQWRTGVLKEYPPAMCGALASSFRHELDQVQTKAGGDPTAQDLALWASLEVTSYSAHIGADYAG